MIESKSPPVSKSTNVRLQGRPFLRTGFRLLGATAPPLAARAAARLFRTPPKHRSSPQEQEALATGRLATLRGGSLRLATWSWGEGPPVILVHGWGSRGGRLASFVQPLVESGFSVVTFDAPGHGASSGRLSSLPEFIWALEAVAAAAGEVALLVAHSMGCSASALAMHRGLAVRRAVFLAPAAYLGVYFRRFADYLGIPPSIREAMQHNLERRFGFHWDDFDVPRVARSMATPLLVFHDREDSEVPWSDGDAIAKAWPKAELVTTTGLGHRRIVHDPDVVSRAVSFLQEGIEEGHRTARPAARG